jgi:hypothetical protein
MIAAASNEAVADNAPAAVQHGHEGLHGIVAMDHPVALIGLVVVSGVVLLVANWHAKRKARRNEV